MKLQSIKGMNDIVPQESIVWQCVERMLSEILTSYGYQQIRLPILENTAVFERSIGDVTDIVQKEMEDARKLFQKYKWPSIDVTRKSVEETAASVLKIHDIFNQK